MEIAIDESKIPICDEVQGFCEILGLDALYVACEGRFIAFVPPSEAERALAIMQAHSLGSKACAIGVVSGDSTNLVTLKSKIGVNRIADMFSGEQLPRIC